MMLDPLWIQCWLKISSTDGSRSAMILQWPCGIVYSKWELLQPLEGVELLLDAPMFSRWWCSFGHIQEEFAFCTMLLAALPPSYDSLWLMRPTTVCRMESKRLRKQSKSLLSGIGQELWLPAPTGIRKSRMQLWVQIFTSRKLIFTTIWFGQWSWEDPECLSTMICLVLAWLLALQW